MRYKTGLKGVLLVGTAFLIMSCGALNTSYRATKATLKATYRVSKGVAVVGMGAGKMVYRVGQFTFQVAMAPLSWPLTHDSIESIGNLPPKEAIRKGKVKSSPYVVNGNRYVPMSVDQAQHFRQTGTASWYGYETFRQKGGHMTANGESFDPDGFNAAHKYLPLPTYVRVKNLENNREIIVRVNDRGPFVDGRIIDLSGGAARKLGFYRKGTARVLVETVMVNDA
ncbi:MAG: septal ring lytic transglycosylase RlpA family protein [Desulfobacterales bacterium]|nr:septal ring lytic transglycosylase RlpA family protein [Desulfobacterales bacterium]MDD4072241.1 septal ring lytic transglycosylase RlpA family protein [Desulfobacterales bacterium]MDD4392970.1 septal ring lytic transglycosylase RlpA family protein [Desulfobacterales bacterium]